MKTLYKTKTGIEIGRVYQRPMPRPDADAELIQSALLYERGPDSVWMTKCKTFIGVLTSRLATSLWRKP
jgi:hypothetical protein